MLLTSKATYYNNKITNCDGNQKAIYNVVGSVLHKKIDTLPDTFDSDVETARGFNEYFQQKIQTIRDQLGNQQDTETVPNCAHEMTSFSALSESDLIKLIRKSSNAFCDLDPAPTWLVKECLDILVSPMQNIVNKSLARGTFPSSMKTAKVIPLIKKANLERNNLKNYRPVSNLSFLSKLIERAVASEINQYIKDHDLGEPLQSAYRAQHSTETALLRVKNDIIHGIVIARLLLWYYWICRLRSTLWTTISF